MAKDNTLQTLLNSTLDKSDPTFLRLSDQIEWYDRKSKECQVRYRILAIATLLSGATIPFIVTFPKLAPIAASLGILVVVCQGLENLMQYKANWTTYRSTAEMLKHEM